MNKFFLICFSTIIVCLICSCKERNGLKRTVIKLDKEVYSREFVKIQQDTLFKKFAFGLYNAFNLKSIESSPFPKEVRIYFFDAFKERFFIEKQKKDSVFIELYNCGTLRRGDSIFMKIGSVIRNEGKCKISYLASLDLIPNYKNPKIYIDTTIYLDGGSTYFIQIKNGSHINSLFIEDPFNLEKSDVELKYYGLETHRLNTGLKVHLVASPFLLFVYLHYFKIFVEAKALG